MQDGVEEQANPKEEFINVEEDPRGYNQRIDKPDIRQPTMVFDDVESPL